MGTGFFVGVPDPRIPSGQSIPYLVTNRHVAAALENCKPLDLQRTYVTMNLKEPVNGNRSSKEPLKVTGQNPWHFPTDGSVDLAVLRFTQLSAKHDHVAIPIDDLLTSSDLSAKGVVPSDRVLTLGLFSQHPGTHGLQPLVREGILAMMPDAPMETTTCKEGSLYLADVHIIPGNSGSPIFIWPTRPESGGITVSGDRTAFGLLGIISGYMYEDQNLTLRPSTNWSGTILGNSEIATVVPAEEIKALLLDPVLKRERDQMFSRGRE